MNKTIKTRINPIELIKVFDEQNNLYKGHTTPIMGIIGEDLGAALFSHFLEENGKKDIQILSIPVTTGNNDGPRLDRWIKVGKILYQTEIKSWCSFQIGGYKLFLDAPPREVKKLAATKWERELTEHYRGAKKFGKASKVLAPMEIPDTQEIKKSTPLVIHWMPVSKDGNPFFSYPVKDLGVNKKLMKQIPKSFKTVHYFSCSLYVRNLIKKGEKEVELSLPNVKMRMSVMQKLVKYNM